MGNYQYISSYQSTEIVNNVLVSATSKCDATDNTQQNGNRVVIVDHLGDITLGQTVTFQSSCIISNDLETKIINEITQTSQNKLSEQQSLMASLIGLDLGNSNQTIKASQTAVINNKISQIMNNTCNNISNSDQSNNIVVVRGGIGSVTLMQSKDSRPNCQLTNVARLSISNVVSQAMKNSIKLVNSLIIIIIAIAVLVAVCVIVALILKARANSSRKGEDTNVDNETEEAITDYKESIDNQQEQELTQSDT